MQEQIGGEATKTGQMDSLNTYEGEFSEQFLQALRTGDTAQCLLLLKQQQVIICDSAQIADWQAGIKQLSLNEKAYIETIEALKADTLHLMQPLSALRPALMGAITYFEKQQDNPEKEPAKWRMARKLLSGLINFGSKQLIQHGQKPTKEELKAQQEGQNMMVGALLAIVKFCIEQKDRLVPIFKSVELAPAYEVIRKHGLITSNDVERIENFTKSKIKLVEQPAPEE